MFLIFTPIYLVILILTIVALVKNWRKSIRNEFRNNDELSAGIILSGILFTSLSPLIGFARFDDFGPEMPFSKAHVLVIELLVIVSAICYWISKFFKKQLPPLVNFLLRAGLIQGIILDIIVTIHFANYLAMGLMFPLFGFELLAPPIAMLFLVYELQCNFRTTQHTALLLSAEKKIILQAGIVVILIFAEQAVLVPTGLHWDSFVRAFTESHGFIFSADTRFPL